MENLSLYSVSFLTFSALPQTALALTDLGTFTYPTSTALESVNKYAVFAQTYNKNNHMEGTIAANYINAGTDAFGVTSAVEQYVDKDEAFCYFAHVVGLGNMFSWCGFTTEWISYDNVNRVAGKTKWSLRQLLGYSIDGITSFSAVPLTFAAKIGLGCCVVSAAMLIFIIARRLLFGDPVTGWASTICVIIFIGGLQLLFLGVIGYYLAKVYLETKHRPHYVVREQSDAVGK